MTEPTIDEQISNIIASDLVLTTDNGQPYIQYDDTAVDKIVALIADQVREARISELKKVASHNNSEYTSDYIEDRIATLNGVNNK